MQPIDPVRSDLQAIVTALDKGETSSVALVERYLNNIKKDNNEGKGLRAVLETAPEDQLLRRARYLDETRRTARQGHLHGIPILIKCSIATDPKLGMATHGGSPALVDSHPFESSDVARRLVDAGMIMIGKANSTMLNGWYGLDIPDGWSAMGGQTLSACSPLGPVGSSSAGSAVSIIANFTPVSLGVESCGSIAMPAAFAGVYALKPSLGMMNMSGIMPISPRFDCVGPMGRSVSDLAALLDIMSPGPTSYLANLDLGSFKIKTEILKVGIITPRETPLSEEAASLFESALELLEPRVQFVKVDIPSLKEVIESEAIETLWAADSGPAWRKYLEGVSGSIKSLSDLVNWHNDHPETSFHPDHPGQGYLERGLLYPEGKGLYPTVEKAAKLCSKMTQEVEGVMDDQGLSALVYPGSCYDWPSAVGPVAGLPLGVVPFDKTKDGMPFSINMVGRRNQESDLLELMKYCEEVYSARLGSTGTYLA